MKLVVDTNVVFSLFNKKSFTYELLTSKRLSLFAPEILKTELDKYKSEITKKFGKSTVNLEEYITLVAEKEYVHMLKKAQQICPDPDDLDFFALALTLNIPLWSLDKQLQKQDTVPVITTFELAEALI